MKKLLVYSHDTYGLGNIRRMLAIGQHLLEVVPELSILLVTGSPVIHALRLPALLDYIKLPCLTRIGRGEYQTKYLSASLDEAIRLRSDLILATAANFQPDLLMVDKKPFGVKGELAATLRYLRSHLPRTRQMLILRDILDNPETIRSNWRRNGHYAAMEQFYDSVLVLGERQIFDSVEEYRFPPSVTGKLEFCGYIRKECGQRDPEEIRRGLQVAPNQRLVLVTSGGGQDGYKMIESYLMGIRLAPQAPTIKSLVICGPEMPDGQRAELQTLADANSQVIFQEFAGEMMELMNAADAVVSMGGYNTVCEILSLGKRAVVVPRAEPTEEQWIRADRMSRLGFFKAIHPGELTPERLMQALSACLAEGDHAPLPDINLNALPAVAARVQTLLFDAQD